MPPHLLPVALPTGRRLAGVVLWAAVLSAAPAALLPAAAAAQTPPAPPAGAAAPTPADDAVAEAARAREAAEDRVAAFRAQVEQTTAVLSEGSRRLEEHQAELARTRAEQAAATRRAEAAVAAADAAQAHLSTVVSHTYRSPVPDSVQLALTTGPDGIRDAVVARADLDRVRGSSSDALREAKAARATADEALRAAEQLSADAAAREAQVAAEVQALRAQARETEAALTAAADALAAAQSAEQAAVDDAAARAAAAATAAEQARLAEEAARAAARSLVARTAGGVLATCTGGTTAGAANGFLPPSSLCPLDDAPGHALRPDAAAAFNALNAAHRAERGGPLCVTDSYRSYPAQVDVYARKPALAAVPGTSNHGWGLAVDFGCGVQTFGTEAHEWMRANAGRFGWFHPAWAQQGGSRPEAWHWEYAAD